MSASFWPIPAVACHPRDSAPGRTFHLRLPAIPDEPIPLLGLGPAITLNCNKETSHDRRRSKRRSNKRRPLWRNLHRDRRKATNLSESRGHSIAIASPKSDEEPVGQRWLLRRVFDCDRLGTKEGDLHSRDNEMPQLPSANRSRLNRNAEVAK